MSNLEKIVDMKVVNLEKTLNKKNRYNWGEGQQSPDSATGNSANHIDSNASLSLF